MHIEKLHTPEEVVAECAIIIDVLRAFTTAAFAFASGAERIIAVSTQETAFELKKLNPDYLLMGEQEGQLIPGFNFGNSPSEILKQKLIGKTLIQRTSAGTQGITRSAKSKKILASSFVVAEATIKRILNLKPRKISFVITGRNNGDEDLALADYLENRIKNRGITDAEPFIQRVLSSPEGLCFASSSYPEFPSADLTHATSIDLFPFSMEVQETTPFPTIYAVDEYGKRKIREVK